MATKDKALDAAEQGDGMAQYPNTTYRKIPAGTQFIPPCIPGWVAAPVRNDPAVIAERKAKGVHIVVQGEHPPILLDDSGYETDDAGHLIYGDCVIGVQRAEDRKAELDDMIAEAKRAMNVAGEGTLTETVVPLDRLTPTGVAS